MSGLIKQSEIECEEEKLKLAKLARRNYLNDPILNVKRSILADAYHKAEILGVTVDPQNHVKYIYTRDTLLKIEEAERSIADHIDEFHPIMCNLFKREY